MSKIQGKPFTEKVIDSLTDELKATLIGLVNGSNQTPAFRSLINVNNLITGADQNKVQHIVLETWNKTYTGYLIYNNSYCVLIAYSLNTQELNIVNINLTNRTYTLVKEVLSILELRMLLNGTVGSSVSADEIDSGSATLGQALLADGNGGASWGSAGAGGKYKQDIKEIQIEANDTIEDVLTKLEIDYSSNHSWGVYFKNKEYVSGPYGQKAFTGDSLYFINGNSYGGFTAMISDVYAKLDLLSSGEPSQIGMIREYTSLSDSAFPMGIKTSKLLPFELGTAGQVLAVNSNADGVEWADAGGGAFIIKATNSAPYVTSLNNYTWDKTVKEVLDAINNKQLMLLDVESKLLNLEVVKANVETYPSQIYDSRMLVANDGINNYTIHWGKPSIANGEYTATFTGDLTAFSGGNMSLSGTVEVVEGDLVDKSNAGDFGVFVRESGGAYNQIKICNKSSLAHYETWKWLQNDTGKLSINLTGTYGIENYLDAVPEVLGAEISYGNLFTTIYDYTLHSMKQTPFLSDLKTSLTGFSYSGNYIFIDSMRLSQSQVLKNAYVKINNLTLSVIKYDVDKVLKFEKTYSNADDQIGELNMVDNYGNMKNNNNVLCPPLPSDASSKTYILKAVNGVLTWVE